MADAGGVKVAVRVRPFNSREKNMNATCCIIMTGPLTKIFDPETKKEKKFTFDFSYWSHDSYKEADDGELVGTAPKYATQRDVYNDLGESILKNAFEGYNSTLFAYGQTGSGKSFSMVGYGVNKGIVPIVCYEMFSKIDSFSSDSNVKFQVVCTMLEIYNEQVKDLLNPKTNKPGGLKIRSKPGIGVYVEGLTPVAVRNYEEIEQRMEEGTANRTVASTKMNATSSRAHTVFGIIFTTLRHDPDTGASSEMAARMNLVDLAGSERAASTGATGDRLKEGCSINASLSALGNVISALADRAMGKKKVFIPYRNSALTRLLQDALGGNSKTVMIAALSPASVNYEETLSTLRYADRAKKIKNKVVKMENPTDKIIRLLKEENNKMKQLLETGGVDLSALSASGGGGGGGSIEEMKEKLRVEHEAKMKATMLENQRIMDDMQKSWADKLADSDALQSGLDGKSGVISTRAAQGSTLPRLTNLHEDAQLSECVVYMFKEGITKMGRKRISEEGMHFHMLSGLSIKPLHAIVKNTGGVITMIGVEGSKTFVNGDHCTEETKLTNGDRVIIGNNFVFRFIDPRLPAPKPVQGESGSDWGNAMEEFQQKQGMRVLSVSSEMGKLEAEELKQRKLLEDKLKEMEAQLKKERLNATKALDLQRAKMEAGEEFTEEDRLKLLDEEKYYKEREARMANNLEKKKELSEAIIQEQMKRKRETKQIEAELARLMPLVNEANEMAGELEKGVQFECRLVIASKETNLSERSEGAMLKKIVVQIRMSSTTNTASIWNWSTVKFDSRLFLMRELFQRFIDFGPQEVSKSKDPFWDPPEAFNIGNAYVYMKALGHLVEIDNAFDIVDYKGDEQGKIKIEIYPEGLDGDDLDYLENSEEILGQSVAFSLRIPSATGIPEKYNNDVFVSYSFNGEKEITPTHETPSTKPAFKYEKRIVVENITEDFRQYLLNEALVFQLKGFNELQTKELASVEEEGQEGGGGVICNQCEETSAEFYCVDCSTNLCGDCFQLLHRSPKKATHVKNAIGNDTAPAVGDVSVCDRCEEEAAHVECLDCNQALCAHCNTLLHKSAKKKGHDRRPMGATPGSPEPETKSASKTETLCERCEESPASVECESCSTALLCSGCNELLHRSKKKAGHVRNNL